MSGVRRALSGEPYGWCSTSRVPDIGALESSWPVVLRECPQETLPGFIVSFRPPPSIPSLLNQWVMIFRRFSPTRSLLRMAFSSRRRCSSFPSLVSPCRGDIQEATRHVMACSRYLVGGGLHYSSCDRWGGGGLPGIAIALVGVY